MDRETVLQNIMVNYGKYGITEDMVNEVMDAGLEGGMSYELIYWDICRKICDITGEEFICTSSDMARAFGMSDDEIAAYNAAIENFIKCNSVYFFILQL